MGRRIPNAYQHPFDPGMGFQDKQVAQNFFGVKPQMGPPAPTADDLFGGARYPDGSLKNPMEQPDHGQRMAGSPHASSGGTRPEPTGIMDEKWEEFKAKLSQSKALAGKQPKKPKGASDVTKQGEGGADVTKTGTMTDPTAAMDDDQSLKELKGLIDKYENKDKKLDLSPLIALTDSWTGSRLLQAYDAPLGDEEREKAVLGLKGKLFQQEADLKYKKAYLTQQAEAERLRQKFREEEAEKNRDLKVQLAHIRGSQQAAGRAASAANKDVTNKSRFLKENKNAVKAIAKKRYGSDDPDDRSYELRMGPINDEIYEFGKHLEAEGQVRPGMGYNMALEFYLQNAAGPDGVD